MVGTIVQAGNPTVFSDVSVPNPFNVSTAATTCLLPAAVPVSSWMPCLCNPNAILTNSTVSALEQSIFNFSSTNGDTICVLAVQQIQSASGIATSIETAAFAESVRKIWAGDGGFNEPRSVLVLLDINDHQLYISTGAAARLNLSDSTATSIATSAVPALKAAQYDQAVLSVVASIQSNLTPPPSSASSGLGAGAIVAIVAAVVATLAVLLCCSRRYVRSWSGQNSRANNLSRKGPAIPASTFTVVTTPGATINSPPVYQKMDQLREAQTDRVSNSGPTSSHYASHNDSNTTATVITYVNSGGNGANYGSHNRTSRNHNYDSCQTETSGGGYGSQDGGGGSGYSQGDDGGGGASWD
ncbi:hypothetical protein HDU84_008087 [Entophlyctis sp. JEL0112]|nr:hypothetical protein HDU84_008087 [Entophlyctis sp. JEL0112]